MQGRPELAAWRLRVQLRGPYQAVRFHHLRAFFSELLERGTGAAVKHAHVKQHTVAQLSVDDDGRSGSIESTTLSSQARQRLVSTVERIDAGEEASPHLGPVRVRIDRLDLLAATSFEDLAKNVRPSRTLRLGFLAPTAFQHGRTFSCFPTPGLVFGSHRARWNALAPAHLRLDLDLDPLEIGISAFEGNSGTVPLTVRGRDGTRDRPIVGFVGSVEYRAARGDDRSLARWQLLGRFAPFCGTGANTAAGMGTTACFPDPDVERTFSVRPRRATRTSQ